MADPPTFAKAQQEILGEDHAYPMISYHPMKTSKAWKLYAKSQGVPFDKANAVSEQIRKYEEAVKLADEDSKDDIDVMDYIAKEYHEIFEKSKEYRGITDSWSIAPCGYLLYEGSIRRQIGLVRINDNICCMMDGHWAEDGHFLKNDLLKVSVVKLIDMAYARIGMPTPTVGELLDMCPPDDPAWDIYKKGCCMGVNQVERKGTAARCTAYQPRNISELCAFVAAIRPGFKSMYKTFESRKPFEYGVQAFDNILKTDELPFSFCLYQEQEMAALNYAGIPMSECYVAIKDIAKKRAAKVLSYKEKFVDGFSKAIMRDEGRNEEEAGQIAEKLWQIIEDSARYSFNACVAGDTQIRRLGEEATNRSLTIEQMFLDGKEEDFKNALSMFPDKRIRENKVVSVRYSGNRPTYRITTESGQWIDCTDNHMFPTTNGKKRLDELTFEDELYVMNDSEDYENTNAPVKTSPIADIESLGSQDVYDVTMADPAHTFISSSGLVTSNSHSYCVSCDSLYIAWVKAHYPLELYETLLKFYDSRGEKDKIAEAKAEAKRFFNIKFPPMRYGQDNRAVVADLERRQITEPISAIKGFSASVGNLLWESSQIPHHNFMELLLDLDRRGVKAKVEPLIKIDYFQQYGNQRELMKMWEMFNFFKQGLAKTLKRESVDGTMLEEPVRRHATWLKKDGTEAKSYTLTDVMAILSEVEEHIRSLNLPDVNDVVKVRNYCEIMGQTGFISGKEEDRPKLYVKEVYPLKRKSDNKQFGYSILTQSIGSGLESRFTVFNKVYKESPIRKDDVIRVLSWEREKGQYFTLKSYVHIREDDLA